MEEKTIFITTKKPLEQSAPSDIVGQLSEELKRGYYTAERRENWVAEMTGIFSVLINTHNLKFDEIFSLILADRIKEE